MEIALDAREMAVVNEVALTVSELPATYDFGAAEGALITEVASSTWEVIVLVLQPFLSHCITVEVV